MNDNDNDNVNPNLNENENRLPFTVYCLQFTVYGQFENLIAKFKNLRQKYGKYDEEIILVGDFDVLCLEWGDGTDESAL